MAKTENSTPTSERKAARSIVMLPVSEVRPYEKNPRKNAEAVKFVKASIEKFGFKQPIIVDSNRVIIAGHTRLEAAKSLGMAEVPCIVADDLTDAQVKALRLADNKVAEFSEWEMNLLGGELGELAEISDIDMGDFGFDLSEFDNIGMEDYETEVMEDEVPEEEEPVCKKGELWQLGEHRLLCGDSTSADDVAKLMNGEMADIAFTSPPYNAGTSEKLTGNTHTTTSKYQNSDDNLSNYDELLFKSTQNNIDFAKYAFINIQMLAGNKIVFCDFVEKFKNQLCDIAIWNKNNAQPAMARRVMNSQFEFIFIFSKDNPSRAVGTRDFRGDVPNVNNMNAQYKNEYSAIHAATFSVEFAGYYVGNFSNQGDIVLDTFGGTGTTMIACEQLGRKCRMMELDPHYCDVIIARWEKLTGQKAVKL